MAQIGDIVYLHDHDTKASVKPRMRWCLVLSITGSMVRVAPRTSDKGKVASSADSMDCFSKDGSFNRWAISVPRYIVDAARNEGQLPEPDLSQVVALFQRRNKP